MSLIHDNGSVPHHVVLRTCVPTYILGQRLISSFLFFICFWCVASVTLLYTIYIYIHYLL